MSCDVLDGDPGRTRTFDLQLRRLLLYPAELRGHHRTRHHRGENPAPSGRGPSAGHHQGVFSKTFPRVHLPPVHLPPVHLPPVHLPTAGDLSIFRRSEYRFAARKCDHSRRNRANSDSVRTEFALGVTASLGALWPRPRDRCGPDGDWGLRRSAPASATPRPRTPASTCSRVHASSWPTPHASRRAAHTPRLAPCTPRLAPCTPHQHL